MPAMITILTVSEIAQGMQRKANLPVKGRPAGTRRQCRHPPALGEEAELTQVSMSIPSLDLTPRCAL